jgi:hypothetical protein
MWSENSFYSRKAKEEERLQISRYAQFYTCLWSFSELGIRIIMTLMINDMRRLNHRVNPHIKLSIQKKQIEHGYSYLPYLLLVPIWIATI